MTRHVAVVPHTHWDREWYSPYQTFRLRLVDLLDALLPVLEADETYAHFLLDGQMAVVDDYLEVRPSAAPRLAALARSGRLAMGPWYALPDEFLVSGETIIRNLQLGLQRSSGFGGAMQVGYLPDMFGHIAQMPQILRGFGFADAVVWRGVPGAVDRTAFWWTAPNGATVRAQYLPVGYGNGAETPRDPPTFAQRLAEHEREIGAMLVDDDVILWMNGTDHQAPQPWLGAVIASVNAAPETRFRVEVTSLSAYLAGAGTTGLPTVRGELRSGARANLLMGVTSNRVDVRQAAARAERALERRAEPLSALFLAADRWPQPLLDLAWTEMIRNSAHDSICACSHDEVGVAVMHRFAEATAIADGLAQRALNALAASLWAAGTYLVNPSARPQSGVVELVIPGEMVSGDPALADVQVLDVRPTEILRLSLTVPELAGAMSQLRSQQFGDVYINRVAIEDRPDGTGFDIEMHADTYLRDNLLIEDIKREVMIRAEANPEARIDVCVSQPPSVRVLARAESVAGFGWRRWESEPLVAAPVTPGGDPFGTNVLGTNVLGTNVLANGIITIQVDLATGCFEVVSVDSATPGLGAYHLGALVDDGDHGDTYNYSPPDHDVVVRVPETVRIELDATGPLVGRIIVYRTYTWSERIDDDAHARVGARQVEVRMALELRAGEPFVRVQTSFVNSCRDHRLRLWLPLPFPTRTSQAECAFTEVERGLEAEGGPTEFGLATFPSRRWVRAGGLTLAHEGVCEYELVDLGDEGATAIAITLLRATGMLSRVDLRYRPLPAGPPLALEGPQLQQLVTGHFAIGLGDVDPYEMVDAVFLPLEVIHANGSGALPVEGTALNIRGAEVSALQRIDGLLHLRLWNATDRAVVASVIGRRGTRVDLRGNELGPFDSEIGLNPWEFATLRLAESPGVTG